MMKQMSLIFAIITTSVVLFAQAGSLDPSFGTNGIAIFQPGFLHDVGQDIAYLNDGSLLVCGSTNLTGSTCGMIMKFNSDGTQNTDFGTSDFVVIQYGTSTFSYKLKVLPDGKILVAGQTYLTTSDSELYVARFLADGTPDQTFGTSGVGITSFSVEEEYCYDMAIQDDGKIILAGRTFYGNTWSTMLFTRFTPDGVLDSTFGTAGYTLVDDSIQDQAILNLGLLSDGTIVGCGYGYVSNPVFNNYVRLVKLDLNGVPNATFGNNGVMIPPVFTDTCKPFGMRIVNDNIYITGFQLNTANDKVIFLTKLDSLGVADPNFGSNGITLTQPSVNDHDNCGYDLTVSPDGYIYVCGVSGFGGMGNPRHSILLRYLMNGQLDPTFNTTGYVVTPIGPDFDECNALVMQPDGKIVTTGFEAEMTTDNDLYLARYFASGPVSFISVDISEIHFGEVGIGETATEEFEISNIGTAALTYDITFPDWISTAVLSGTIAAGDSVTISVPFSPAAAMEYSGIIEIANNSVNQPLMEIDVDGTGAIFILDPPTNLSVNTSTGIFSWSAPQIGEPTGYEIFLNEEMQGATPGLEWQFITLRPGYTYEAGVRAISGEGQSDLATIVFVYEGASAEDYLIGMVGLQGNYPNPFSAQTNICFKLMFPAETELAVYNLKGQKIKILSQGLLAKGDYTFLWNGEDDHCKPLPSGVYFYMVKCGTSQETGKMILIK
jgi:uncharacterized delta-60 repeat protein